MVRTAGGSNGERLRLSERDGVLPWTRHCLVCGEQNMRGFQQRSRVQGGNTVVLDYVPRETDVGWKTLVHGGISMILLDEVMTWAAMLASRRACVAVDVHTRLRAPVRVGKAVRAEGWACRVSGRMCETGGCLLDVEGQVLSETTGRYLPMPKSEFALSRDDFMTDGDSLDLGDLITEGGSHDHA
ncbi:MAG: hypothetical protein A2498_08850 [Lentisphaerae bacterium RIFOXYC12_FULL_60_16]|nr:MAG: hypothetical protein A2498_08850 [Lentisphaerae bacterium RIFOXYC12_FULL_60_16]OGV81031.1 MAG: hypothetical protein A2340_07215 [Lentisphaerae bacterium RIFOXYB12_FULL_60_10]